MKGCLRYVIPVGLASTPYISQVFLAGKTTKYMAMYGVYIRYFWQGNQPNVRPCTVYIYGSGPAYKPAFDCVQRHCVYVWDGLFVREGVGASGRRYLSALSVCRGTVCRCGRDRLSVRGWLGYVVRNTQTFTRSAKRVHTYKGLARNIILYNTVFLAGKSPNIRSHTECIFTVLANPTHTQSVHVHSVWDCSCVY